MPSSSAPQNAAQPDSEVSSATARRVDRVLRAVLAVQIAGYLAGSWLGESPVVEFLYFSVGTSESTAVTAATLAGFALACAAAGAAIRPRRWYLVPTALWFFGVACLDWWLGGAPHAHLAPVADAVRWMAPLVLARLAVGGTEFDLGAERMLRYAAAATFAAHGWEALAHHPGFLDFLFGAAQRVGVTLAEPAARRILTGIGALDLAVAAILASGVRWRPLVGWMAGWAAVAAGARTVELGWAGLPATLIRAANAGVPWALLVAWSGGGFDGSGSGNSSSGASSDEPPE